MNCERCQELVSDLLDGSLSRQDELLLNQHLEECLGCAEVRRDLESIVTFCRVHRDEYSAPPNERALWLRIRNTLEGENRAVVAAQSAPPAARGRGWFTRKWELSLPQLAASVAGIVLVASLSTVALLRGMESNSARSVTEVDTTRGGASINSRTWQQQQAINYWNQRVELNKVRWSQDMRDTFERNLQVIDQAVNNSMTELNRNPHDEVSEEMLNAALNEKLALLKEFSDL